MSVAVKHAGNALSFDDPVALFQTQLTLASLTGNRNQYVPSGDGQRFLFSEQVENASSRIAVVMNWRKLLERP